jgi:uracil-DNA glycosylase
MEMYLEKSWKLALNEEFQKPYFLDLMKFINSEYTAKVGAIFPSKSTIFQALNLCPINTIKVVIIGQDPYPTKGHAHGLCFSVERNIKPFPKSLINIFKEIENDLNVTFPENGNLERWAEQGVLLLNSVLTVEEGKADSHSKKGWEKFTDAIIQKLNEQTEGVVYLLWGSKAQEKAHKVNTEKNLVLKSVHPSPLSSYRGFFGCKHFSQSNEYLIKMNKEPIIW